MASTAWAACVALSCVSLSLAEAHAGDTPGIPEMGGVLWPVDGNAIAVEIAQIAAEMERTRDNSIVDSAGTLFAFF